MITNNLILQKIKQQINEAEQLINDPILFKEALKRVELLCELVTESKESPESATLETKELLDSTKQESKKQSVEIPNKHISTDLPSDSIFDF